MIEGHKASNVLSPEDKEWLEANLDEDLGED